MKINNVPESARSHKFIVARLSDNDYWYYGAYDTVERAFSVAEEVCGAVFPVSEVV